MVAKSQNGNLHKAKTSKNDEFYTQLSDIESEMKHYKDHFRGKIIYCNCDDPTWSNFYKYFSLNFEHLGLKKLITTHFEKNEDIKSYKLELFEYGKEPIKTELKGNGDFRSEECIGLLKESDIVITNPPFSLFREYIAQLMEYNKKFLVIGNINAITYNEIFKLIKENKAWLGFNMGRGISGFIVPEHYELYGTEARIDALGNRIVSTNNCLWLTNIEHKKRNEELILYKTYNEREYPKYDNYDAINVDKTKEIPLDYDGYMGVPITFLDKYNPNQFEIIGLGNGRDNFNPSKDYINPCMISKDGIKKNGNAINRVLAIETNIPPKGIYYTTDNSGYLIAPYARIIIKNKRNSII